jgi:hypothetical protein
MLETTTSKLWGRSLCSLAALFLSCHAHATFLGIQVLNTTGNSIGLAEYSIYAEFDNPGDELYGVLSNIQVTTGFFHNTINGMGASALPFTSAQSAMSDHPDADSFVTIGLPSGENNVTDLLPGFDIDGFLYGTTLGEEGAWAVSTGNGQGLAGPSGLVLIAVFTPLNDAAGIPGVVSGTVTVGYGAADGSLQFADASFITPGPGALGLLALAGLMGRTRRRWS